MAKKTILEDEKRIITKIRKGDKKLREEFIKKNQGLVIHIAKKYAFSPEILPDLIAEGNMGLMRAIEKFDFRKKVKFGTYAYFWIKRFVLRAIMKEFEILKIPERYHEFKEKFEEINNAYNLKYGRDATDEELSKELKIPLNIIKKLKKYSDDFTIISSDFYNGEKDIDLFDLINTKKKKAEGLWDVLRNKDILSKIFERIKVKEKRANIDIWFEVLKLHYGLENGIQYSYKEIAKKLGVTRQRVHQIKKICLKKLREEWEEMRNEGFEEFNSDNS
ncbi:MAG: sigma-70 family RNA polymerase sigma factor [bacterium]|nr:sigma-70 family RNA polymerase sigma factor [bacterium]MDW8163251.1 sigma-70 family RNA polymerase sigma factor [Candidatus Omnitrophota bacterium]